MIDPDDLPWSSEAEQSVLGGLLLDNSAWDRVGDLITDRCFFDGRHAEIYRAIGSLVNASKPADVITVFTVLQDWASDAAIEVSMEYLNALSASVPSAANARRYAEIVLEKWLTRALMEKLDHGLTVARGRGTAMEKVAKVAESIQQLEITQVAMVPEQLGTTLVELVDHTNALATGETPLALSTFLPGLDALIDGFKPGLVYLLGARPGMGKTALALWWSGKHACLHDPITRVEYLSQEMPKLEVTQRICASKAQISYTRLRKGDLDPDEWSRFTAAIDDMRGAHLWIDEQTGLSAGDIAIKARFVKDLNLLVLDYFQLCEGADGGARDGSRNSELEAISRALKTLAKQRRCAVLVLSALNRKVDERAHRRPIMSDFRDCGALEADADVIMTLFPARNHMATLGCMVMGMDVLKHRQGPTGELALNFYKEFMSWGQSEYELADLLKDKGSKDGGGAL